MNDLISRQATIDAIEKIYLPKAKGETAAEEINRVAWRCALNCAKEMVVHLPPAQRWIPVTEGLPEAKKAVLVWCPFYKNIFCAYRKEECDGWYIYGAYFTPIDYDVTAWMPLPEPYKEENDNG